MTPSDLKYTRDHKWVKQESGGATIGITDYAQMDAARHDACVRGLK
jgi:glycine cleavage system H lipoate-binding protein